MVSVHLKMSVWNFVLPAQSLHTLVLAVLGGLSLSQEVLVVCALPINPDRVASVHDGEHVLPVGHRVWHQDLFHKAAMGPLQTAHTEVMEERMYPQLQSYLLS